MLYLPVISTLASTSSLILIIIFSFLSFLHFYWGFGGKKWLNEVTPKKANGEELFVVKPLHSLIVGIGLLLVGLFVNFRIGYIGAYYPNLSKYGMIFLGTIFMLRALGDFKYVGFFKKIKNSDFAIRDSKIYSPLCLVIGTLFFLIEYTDPYFDFKFW